MIVDNGKYYLYRHIRLDKNEPFYIGIGGKEANKGGYYRSERVSNRNYLWNNIYNACDKNIRIEIVCESDDFNFIKTKEQEFISLYGRKNNGTGILSNLTDGGDGSIGAVYTEERRKKQSEAIKNSPFNLKGKKLPEWWKDKIRQTKFGKDNPAYGKISCAAKKVINVLTGEIYDSVLLAAQSINISDKKLYGWLYKGQNKSQFLLLEKYNEVGKEKSKELIYQKSKQVGFRHKSVINTETGKEYKNAKIAAEEQGYNPIYFRCMLAGTRINTTKFKYKNG